MNTKAKVQAVKESYERHLRDAINNAKWLGYSPQALINDIIILSQICK